MKSNSESNVRIPSRYTKEKIRIRKRSSSLGNMPRPRPPTNYKMVRSESFDSSNKSSNNSSSKGSRTSRASILTPRGPFLPWSFKQISSSLLPSDVEHGLTQSEVQRHGGSPTRKGNGRNNRRGPNIKVTSTKSNKDENLFIDAVTPRTGRNLNKVSDHSFKYTPSLKYDDDQDISIDSESSHSGTFGESSKESRMDTIYNEYSAAAAAAVRHTKNTNTKSTPTHERSKSADFADFSLRTQAICIHIY